jgi:hypothetical protein
MLAGECGIENCLAFDFGHVFLGFRENEHPILGSLNPTASFWVRFDR